MFTDYTARTSFSLARKLVASHPHLPMLELWPLKFLALATNLPLARLFTTSSSTVNKMSFFIVNNNFFTRSVVSYNTSELPLFTLSAVSNAPKLSVYDSLDSEVIQSYLEFSIAALLFYSMKEGACSEQSSRMTAMDNASKNAG
jgi:F0F1-type ATP synthase gamma subunit